MSTDRNAETAIIPSPEAGAVAALAARPASVRVDFGAISHPGLVRPNNEDHYLISRISRTRFLRGERTPTCKR